MSVLVYVSACFSEGDKPPRARWRHDNFMAELPMLPSGPIAYVPHGMHDYRPELTEAPDRRIATTRRIGQRVLLLAATGDEPAFLAARDALDRIGVPYQSLIATQQEVTASLLSDGASTCYFNSIIFATSGLAYLDAAHIWQSALTPDEWSRIAGFELACSAREAIWYAWPSPDLGLTYASTFPWTESVDGVVREPSFFLGVRAGATIPFRRATGYRGTIIDPSATTALIEDTNGGVLLAVHKWADGREGLFSMVDGSPYLTHSLLLEYDMIRWLTRNMFLGQKRAYLSPQIDDLFIDNDMWIVGVGNHGTEQFRITGTDLSGLVAWQQSLHASLPATSTFVTDLAFNGIGTLVDEYPDETLLAAARSAGPWLTWLNHTWDHENMDLLSYGQAREEVALNCTLARSLELNGFSCRDLVTPDMSGLSNPAALRGIVDAGVRYVVSDTSISATIRPGSPGTNSSFNVGRTNSLEQRIYQVPRHPTNVFYDVATPEAETDEYNAIYHAYYGRDLTYAEVLGQDSAFGLYYLLQGDIDPLMFHQANLADYGGGRSVYSDWVDAVLNQFLALSSRPILTLAEEDIGLAMQERGRLDACGVTATVVESDGTRSLELSATGACTVPITGLTAPEHGEVDLYGGDVTTLVPMSSYSVRFIPLSP